MNEEVEAIEAALRASRDEGTVELVLRRGEQTAQRLDAIAALADRLSNRLRARVISECRERLGAPL
jgi:hypothetical protein